MKLTALVTIFLLMRATLFAQTGSWSGKLNVQGTSLTLVFNFNEDGCTMDSPDQGAKGIKAEKEYSPTGKLTVTIPSIGARFEGFYIMNSITGTFIQSGLSFPLALKPGAPELKRPQTPKQPFPYNEEAVSFSNGEPILKGTLTIPQSCTKDTPVVLLVTGSGLQNRDEEIYEHKPFAVIADALARAGIATLRYDDRGFGESTGDIVNFTTEDLKNDALAGIELLRGRFNKVGVAGHSEGGSIAFMLASENKVDFVISMAGAIMPMKATLVKQNDHALRELGLPYSVVDEYISVISDAFDAISEGKTPKQIESSTLPEALKQNYSMAVAQSSTPYMKYLLGMDIRNILDRVKCPVIAFNGTLDTQVDCKDNLDALKTGLNQISPVIVPVEGVNHLFQHCTTGSTSEYKEIEETFAPEVLNQIINWLSKL